MGYSRIDTCTRTTIPNMLFSAKRKVSLGTDARLVLGDRNRATHGDLAAPVQPLADVLECGLRTLPAINES